MCLARRSRRWRASSQNPRKTNSPGLNGHRALATLQFLPAVSPASNVARPIGTMAATTSFFWAPSKPTPTTGTSCSCSPTAVMADFLVATTLEGRGALHEKASLAQTYARQAEAALSGGPPQGIRRESDRILFRRGFWRRHPRSGAPAGRDAAAALSLLSKQGRTDQGSLSYGLSGA